MPDAGATTHLVRVVIDALMRGKAVEIDGLGVFSRDPAGGCRFEARPSTQVFIAYVKEDIDQAARLYDSLAAAGFHPWMDVRKLLPGQNWPRSIESAIESSDFFVACFSAHSVNKKGGFQAEIRYALDCARQLPLDEIFIMPVRMDSCPVPRKIQREFQYVDLFPDWNSGVGRVIATIRREVERRRLQLCPGAA